VKNRKIHALVNSEGLPMRVIVHSAAIQDRDGAGLVLDKIRHPFPWLKPIWADGGYNAWQVDATVATVPLLHMEIVKRSDDRKGFVVLPRRWVVERACSWFGRNRCLAEDFENVAETLASFVILASIQLALRPGLPWCRSQTRQTAGWECLIIGPRKRRVVPPPRPSARFRFS
jgi:transposase